MTSQPIPSKGGRRPWVGRTLVCLWLAAAAACGQGRGVSSQETPEDVLRMYAAASLIDVLTALQPELERVGSMRLAITPGASGTLARQIERGAPADLFVSASPEWTAALDQDGRLDAGSSCNWLANTLVCVIAAEAEWVPAGPADLGSANLDTLALAIDTAPVGRYAREALQRAHVVAPARIVEGLNARDTLAKVALGAAQAGIVYRTDTALEPRVRIAFTFDPSTHAPIVYPLAVLQTAAHPDAARAVVDFLCRGGGRKQIEAHGFAVLSSADDA